MTVALGIRFTLCMLYSFFLTTANLFVLGLAFCVFVYFVFLSVFSEFGMVVTYQCIIDCRLRNDICVEWDTKPCSFTHYVSPTAGRRDV